MVPVIYIIDAAAAGKFGKWSRRDRESTQRIFFFKLFHYVSLGLKEQVFSPLILISVGSHSCVVTWSS